MSNPLDFCKFRRTEELIALLPCDDLVLEIQPAIN